MAVGVLAGCYNGPGATTTMQAMQPTGNGTQAAIGALRIENATLVVGDVTSSLVTRIYNDGQTADAITAVTIGGQPAEVLPAQQQLEPGDEISFGFPVPATDIIRGPGFPVSEYVPVTISFISAGSVELSVLAVPPTGIYSGLLD
jgi:hypothetical protein